MEGRLVEKINQDDLWEIDTEGKEINIVREKLSMKESEKEKTILAAAKLLSQCPNPKGEVSKKTGLAVGKVQSGKTSNFISLAALALDNGYQLIIIFGGKTNILLKQNYDRIYDSFNIEHRKDYKFSVEMSNKLNPIELRDNYNNGKNIIISALKEKSHIKKIIDCLNEASLTQKPILIIDDEGDQISLNGAINKDKETKTFKFFKDLINILPYSAFISVTATPQANLLTPICNVLSPDFITLVPPGKDYCGFDVFHSKKQTQYIKIIDDNDNFILDIDAGVPLSFKEALSCFYVGGIYRTINGDFDNHSMLVHPSKNTIDHNLIYEKIRTVKEDLENKIKNYKYDDYSYNEINSFLNYGIEELRKTTDINFKPEDVIEYLKEELKLTKLNVVNGTSLTNEINYKENKNNIVIGGEMVERGLTIKGLAVTYIVRENKGLETADTVEQRSRWFGYRPYLDLCRIYMTDSMAENFYNLNLHEKKMWDLISYSNTQGWKAKNMPRVFELDEHFRPTRKNVYKSVDRFPFGEWKFAKSITGIENQILNLNKKYEEFFADKEYERITYKNFSHKFYRNIDMSEFSSFIKMYDNKENSKAIRWFNMLESILTIEKLPLKINVMIMRDGVNEHHEFRNGSVANIMQGSNSIEGEDNYYPADEHVNDKEIVIQIHNVINDGKCYPLLACFCPLIGKAKSIIIGDNDD